MNHGLSSRPPLLLCLPLLLSLACGGSAPEPVAPISSPEPTSAPIPTATPPSAPVAPTQPTVAAKEEPPPAPEPPPTPAAKPPPPPPPAQLEGTLKSHKGRELTVKVSGDAPAVGAKGSLERFFEGKPGEASPLGALGGLFGGTIQGWLGIASVTVKKLDKDVVTLTIDEEKSKMSVNGKPVDQFKTGAKVRLAIAAPAP